MTCSRCGTVLPEGSSVCPVCGNQNDAPYVPKHAAPNGAAQPQQNNMFICPNCGRPVPQGSAFCGTCGQRFAAPKAPAKKNYSAAAKKTKLWIPAAAAVALILVVALVIGMFSSLGGPLLKIGSAAKKTVDAGNFTADFEAEVDGEGVEGTLYADINVKKRTVSMYITLEMDGDEVIVGIYDGYAFIHYDGYYYSYSDCVDIEDQLDEIFDAYEESGKKDMSELLEDLEELIYNMTWEELSDYVDMDVLEKCLKTYAKAASKEKWLKQNMGFSQSKKSGETLYTFEPELSEFLLASLPYFEEAFEDADMYEELMEDLEDYGDDLDDEFAMEVTIGVKSGYLSSMSGTVEVDGDEMEFTVKIYDVNKTKLDEAELADLLDDAK